MKLRIILLIFCLALCLASGATASGPCTPDDGDNDMGNATPIGYKDSVNGVVCPDDPYDFYVLRIAEGDNVSGSITFSSSQASTVLFIGHDESGQMLVDGKATTGDNLQFTIDVPEGKLLPGTYYARVSFESGADYDHEYLLAIDLAKITRAPSDGKFVEDNSPEIRPTHMDVVLPSQPWPMYRGDARRTGRSTYPGPPALSKVELVADLWFSVAPTARDDEERVFHFQGPLMRSPDTFYCIGYHEGVEELVTTSSDKGYRLIVCGLSTGNPWWFTDISTSKICLDHRGNILYATTDELTKNNYTLKAFSPVWEVLFPGTEICNLNGYHYLTNLIGGRLYLHRGKIDGLFFITAFEPGGEVAWQSNRFNNPMIGMMEDFNGDFYVRVISEGLYKVGPDGEILWNVLKQPQMQKPTGLIPADKSGRFGPICGDDGRIWVSTRTMSSAEYHVFNTDGTEYKFGNFGADINPLVCCCGHDGRFYVATSTIEIRCYNDWDELVWSTGLSPPNSMMNTAITIQDMVMDSKDMIYVLKKLSGPNAGDVSIEVFAINPNGQIVSSTTINLPANAGPENELAIGDDKKLVLLNSGGLLYVMSGFEIDPGAIKGKIRLEVKDN